jgi:hypothetical protein
MLTSFLIGLILFTSNQSIPMLFQNAITVEAEILEIKPRLSDNNQCYLPIRNSLILPKSLYINWGIILEFPPDTTFSLNPKIY